MAEYGHLGENDSMDNSETQLCLSRLVLAARDVELMAVFYRDVLGFEQIQSDEPTSASFDMGGMILVVQPGRAAVQDEHMHGPRMEFFIANVEQLRDQLIEQGARMGKLKSFGPLVTCDGTDPEGNPFRLSNRPPPA